MFSPATGKRASKKNPEKLSDLPSFRILLFIANVTLGIDCYPFSQIKVHVTHQTHLVNVLAQCNTLQGLSVHSKTEMGTEFSHLGYQANYRYGSSFSISRQMRNLIQASWRKLSRRLYLGIIPWPPRCIHLELFLKLRIVNLSNLYVTQ